MFADDTFGLKSGNDLMTLIDSINTDINRMAIWFKANKLAVNKSKTKFIIFHARSKKLPLNLPEVKIDENEPGLPFDPSKITVLERIHDKNENIECRAYKLLGIYLDEHLSLEHHVHHLTKKLNKSMYCIKMAKNNLNDSGLRALYFALIHSHLNYCPIILNCLSQSNKNKIFKIQKKAIRVITGSKYNAHTSPLFLRLGILPFEKLIKQSKLLFMHSINFNYAPKSFNETWIKNGERNGNWNLRNSDLFYIPNPRVDFFKKMPLYALPEAWNTCGNLMFYENKITFKHALRESLLEELLAND